MNAKIDEWQQYFDEAGRRHWRWPASDVRDVRLKAEGQHRHVPLPEPSRARDNPKRERGE